MRLWKWVETSTLGQSSPLATQCRRVAVSRDSPSFCGQEGGGETKEVKVTQGRRASCILHTYVHTNVFVPRSHKQYHLYEGSHPLTVAVPLPNSSRMIKDLLTHNLTAADT